MELSLQVETVSLLRFLTSCIQICWSKGVLVFQGLAQRKAILKLILRNEKVSAVCLKDKINTWLHFSRPFYILMFVTSQNELISSYLKGDEMSSKFERACLPLAPRTPPPKKTTTPKDQAAKKPPTHTTTTTKKKLQQQKSSNLRYAFVYVFAVLHLLYKFFMWDGKYCSVLNLAAHLHNLNKSNAHWFHVKMCVCVCAGSISKLRRAGCHDGWFLRQWSPRGLQSGGCHNGAWIHAGGSLPWCWIVSLFFFFSFLWLFHWESWGHSGGLLR